MAITLHHLRFSRSTRIIWLLEELGLEYSLIEHHRHEETNRSQEDLFAIHPLGKAPTIDIDGRIMVESGAIIEYLIEGYGGGKLGVLPGSPERSAYLEWLQFVEGSMAMPVLLTLLGPRMGGLDKLPILQGFMAGEVTKMLDYVDGHMQGREYLLDAGFSGADINMEYLLELISLTGMLESRPGAKAYLERMMARDGYKKAIEIGGLLTPPMAG